MEHTEKPKNSSEKFKTQAKKLKNSSEELKVSANPLGLLAENRSKKKPEPKIMLEKFYSSFESVAHEIKVPL